MRPVNVADRKGRNFDDQVAFGSFSTEPPIIPGIRSPLRAVNDRIGVAAQYISQKVESRTGAVAGGLRPSLRFPSPLIELDVPISGIQLSDQLHREAFDAAVRGRRSRRSRPRSP